MTVLKFEPPAKLDRNSESENAAADTHQQSHRADVISLTERFPEAFRMENAVIRHQVTDALTSIAEHKAARLARYFGLDGLPAEQSSGEANASKAVLDALQDVDPTTDPGSRETLQKLHVIAGKIASATEADPDALRALWKAPRKNPLRTDLVSAEEVKQLEQAQEVEFA